MDVLERVLSDPARGGFVVKKLINCNKGEVERAISTLTQKRVHGETILVYFSGHGIRDDDGNLYLALADTECDDLWATALFAPGLCFKLDKSLADQQLVILDCCHSGSFSPGAKSTIGDSVGTQEIFIREGRGRVVLTASDATSFAWESGSTSAITDESLFTHHLVRGIETGDADLEGDARIDTDELYRYVYREVVRERPDQHPMKFGQAQEGKLIVSLAPVKIRPLPDYVVSAMNNPIKGARVAVVEYLETTVQQGSPGERITAYAALRTLVRDDSREVSATAAAALKRNAAPAGFVEEDSAEPAPVMVSPWTAAAAAPTVSPSTSPVAEPPSSGVPLTSQVGTSDAAADVGMGGHTQHSAEIASNPDTQFGDQGALPLLTPSLLDRLIDVDPTYREDYTPVSNRTIRTSFFGLHRDLENMLNTTAPWADALAEFPDVQASVLNYGLREIQSFERYSPGGRHRIAQRIQEAIRRFEPRLGRVLVTAALDAAGPSEPRFRIEGSLLLDQGHGPVPHAVVFTADFDTGRSRLQVAI